jgi:hypothetical protein
MSNEGQHNLAPMRLDGQVSSGSQSASWRCSTRESTASQPRGMDDAGTLLPMLGVDHQWFYAHRKLLDGLRLGGPSGRLRANGKAPSMGHGVERGAGR